MIGSGAVSQHSGKVYGRATAQHDRDRNEIEPVLTLTRGWLNPRAGKLSLAVAQHQQGVWPAIIGCRLRRSRGACSLHVLRRIASRARQLLRGRLVCGRFRRVQSNLQEDPFELSEPRRLQ